MLEVEEVKDAEVKLGDCLEVLPTLEPESVRTSLRGVKPMSRSRRRNPVKHDCPNKWRRRHEWRRLRAAERSHGREEDPRRFRVWRDIYAWWTREDRELWHGDKLERK